MPRLDAAQLKKRRLKYLLAVPVVLLAFPVVLKVLGVKPVNHAQTSPDNPDASLRTRFYAASPAEVLEHVRAVVPTLSTYGQGWRMVDARLVEHTAAASSARCEVPVLFFTDDLEVQITPGSGGRGGRGGSIVDVRSASRVGKGDFGENARHIRQILRALDGRLPAAP